MKLRSHLIVLVLAAIVPLLVFAVVTMRQEIEEQRQILDRGMHDTARALTLAVDGEVKTSLAILETLASSPFLDSGDLKSFHQLSARAMEGRRGAYVILFDRSGEPLVNSSRPFGSALPNPIQGAKPAGFNSRYPDVPLGGAEPVRKVLETGRPFVSDLFISLVTQAPRIGFDIPVVRQGGLRYVLELSVDAGEFARLLADQNPPKDSVLAIVDRRGLAIARSVNASTRVGRPLARELAEQIASSDSGSGTGRNSEGLPVFQVFTRSPLTGWKTSVSVAQSAAFAPLSEAMTTLVGGAAIAILVALAAAAGFGRRLSRPIAMLAASAEAMARGERSDVGASSIRELEELRSALVIAGATARRAAEERERSVVNHVVDGIIAIDERGMVTAFNPAAERMFGFAAGEVIGQNVRTLMPEPYRSGHDGYLANYLTTGQAKIIGIGREVVGLRKDGSTFPMDLAVSEFRAGSQRLFTGIVRDITERKRVEQALRDADRHKDEFLAMLGHELRNPLAALTTAAHVLRAAAPKDSTTASAQGVIERQAEHMVRLIDDLLDITRVKLGKISLRREPFDLAELVSEFIQLRRAAGVFTDRATVRVDLAPVWVNADRARLEQVVSNLLQNALKFTPRNGRIDVSVQPRGVEAALRVTDSGRGIAPDVLPTIFEPFVQGAQNLDRAEGGLGLGLALVKRLAELHGGSVTAQSGGEGLGATFTVTLPAIAAPREPRVLAPVKGGCSFRPLRILVIEDNQDARQMLREALTMDGHEVREAASGTAGIQAAGEMDPEAVLIDVGLPDMDGYQVARRLRALPGGGSFVLVALSGYGQDDDRGQAGEAGFDAQLVKPVSVAHLGETILQLVARNQVTAK
jgi:PAS domain S-box-containing protein